jgi:flagellar basal body rod protein FlgC
MRNVILVPSPFHINSGTAHSPVMSADITTKQVSQIYVNGYPATHHTNTAGASECWTITNTAIPSSSSSFMYDPMHEHTDWYGFPSYTNMDLIYDSHDIKNCFWSFSDFTAELEESSTDTILVQKATNSSWKLRFKAQADFQYWLKRQHKRKPHTFRLGEISQDTDQADVIAKHMEIKTWCKENLVGPYEHDSRGKTLDVCIKNDNDAVLFKLRWLDVDI